MRAQLANGNWDIAFQDATTVVAQRGGKNISGSGVNVGNCIIAAHEIICLYLLTRAPDNPGLITCIRNLFVQLRGKSAELSPIAAVISIKPLVSLSHRHPAALETIDAEMN
ncbi:MAG: hypothetical protein EZS28_028244 [Streblomastix strix]|nr:MAG: hypothetical protein EZS28_028244 [Streblomastix strix]